MDAGRLTRRSILGSAAFAGAAAAAATWLGDVRVARADEPAAAGSSALSTGALVALAYEALPGFLSKEQVGLHHAKHYGGALKALTDIEARLYAGDGVTDKAARRELGRAQSEKANSVVLHELYFRGMADKAPPPAEDVRTDLTKRFG